jgi:hypothetical protein
MVLVSCQNVRGERREHDRIIDPACEAVTRIQETYAGLRFSSLEPARAAPRLPNSESSARIEPICATRSSEWSGTRDPLCVIDDQAVNACAGVVIIDRRGTIGVRRDGVLPVRSGERRTRAPHRPADARDPGLPVLTSDYDHWIAIDDIVRFNAACDAFDLVPTRPPDDARRTGRYVLENDEHVDVLVSRSARTVEGRLVEFESIWNRRQSVDLGGGVHVAIPTIDDLILTKQIEPRPKVIEDVRLLRALKGEGEE